MIRYAGWNTEVRRSDKPDTVVGPIINETQMENLRKRIAEARASNLRLLVGGDAHGLLLPPHLFADVPNDHPLARNELFGPVAPVIRAKG